MRFWLPVCPGDANGPRMGLIAKVAFSSPSSCPDTVKTVAGVAPETFDKQKIKNKYIKGLEMKVAGTVVA